MSKDSIYNRKADACLGEHCTVRRHVEEIAHHKMQEKVYENKIQPKRGFIREDKSL